MVTLCISASTYKRISTLLVGLAISAVTLLAQQRADTIGVAAEIVHYGEAILWVKPASLLNEQVSIPFSVDVVKADSARVYVSKKTINSLLNIQFQSVKLCPKPVKIKSSLSSSYRSYNQYVAYCDSLQKRYPQLVDCDTIGYSVDNKAILVLTFNPTAQTKPEMMWVGSIHGDEPQGYVLLQALADSLIAGYFSSEAVKNLVDNTHIYIIPSINPDGLFRNNNVPSEYSTRYNSNYEDLNRNFPDFTFDDQLTLSQRQPEVQALINFVAKHRICLSGGIHSGAEVVNYPWDSKSALHPDSSWLAKTALAYAKLVQQNGPVNYFTDVSNTGITNGYAWYLVNGGQQDYMTAFAGSREFTFEVSSNKWLPSSDFTRFWNYNKQAIMNFTATALMASSGRLVNQSSGLPVVGKVWTANTDTAFCGVATNGDGYFYKFLDANESLIGSNDVKSTVQIIDFVNPYEKVSVPTYTNNADIVLYPTVFDSELNLLNTKNISVVISVFDINGREIYELNTNKSGKLNIPNLSKGIYLVSVKSLMSNQVFKVIKK